MASLSDISSYKHNWDYKVNPKMFALQALCSLAVELKASEDKPLDWDYWHNYWRGIYIKNNKNWITI